MAVYSGDPKHVPGTTLQITPHGHEPAKSPLRGCPTALDFFPPPLYPLLHPPSASADCGGRAPGEGRVVVGESHRGDFGLRPGKMTRK